MIIIFFIMLIAIGYLAFKLNRMEKYYDDILDQQCEDIKALARKSK